MLRIHNMLSHIHIGDRSDNVKRDTRRMLEEKLARAWTGRNYDSDVFDVFPCPFVIVMCTYYSKYRSSTHIH